MWSLEIWTTLSHYTTKICPQDIGNSDEDPSTHSLPINEPENSQTYRNNMGGQKMFVSFFSTTFVRSVFHSVQQLLSDTWVVFQTCTQKHTFTSSISYCGPIVSATEQQTSVNLSNIKFQENPLCSSQPVTYTQLGMTKFLRGIPLSTHYCIPSSSNRSAPTSQWPLSLSTSVWTYWR